MGDDYCRPFDVWIRQTWELIRSDPNQLSALLAKWEDENIEKLGLAATRAGPADRVPGAPE